MTPPLRLGFWAPVLNCVGGTETHALTLWPRLAADPAFQLMGLAVLDDPADVDPDTARRLGAILPVTVGSDACAALAAQCDVLVLWGIAHPDAVLDPTAPRPTLVFVVHGDAAFWWQVDTLDAADPAVDRYVAVSQAALAVIPEHRQHLATVIPNGLDPARLRPTLSRKAQRAAWGVPPGKKVVGMLGRLSKEKNPFALAACVHHLPEKWVGVIVGTGEEYGHVRADGFVQCPLRLFMPGATQDVGSALGAFDVLLVPSHSEGFCYAAVEGLLAGVPVVMTPVGVALEHPGWFTSIPLNADGPMLARAVRNAARTHDLWCRHFTGAVGFIYGADAMATRWRDFLLSLPVPSRDAACVN